VELKRFSKAHYQQSKALKRENIVSRRNFETESRGNNQMVETNRLPKKAFGSPQPLLH